MEFKKCVFTLGFCIDGSKVQSVKTVKLVKWEPQMESSKSPVTVTPEPPLNARMEPRFNKYERSHPQERVVLLWSAAFLLPVGPKRFCAVRPLASRGFACWLYYLPAAEQKVHAF